MSIKYNGGIKFTLRSAKDKTYQEVQDGIICKRFKLL